MRITARVAGAGNNGLTRIPYLDIESIDKDLCTDGKLDEAKCRQAMNVEGNGVQMSSDDCLPVFAFVTELLQQTRGAIQYMLDNRKESKDAHDDAECADDRHAERNMRKGRWVYVRMDCGYSHATGTVKFRVDIQNPKGIVGVAERIALDYALVVARIANHIADELTAAHGDWSFDFKGGEGCPTLFSDARQIDSDLKRRKEKKSENDKRLFCERRTAAGYCSPCNFECPHCKSGKCVEVQ